MLFQRIPTLIRQHPTLTNTYQDQTELKLITLHHIAIHLKMMAIRAVATENLDQQRKQVRIIERKLQLDMAKMARTVL